MPRKCQKYRSNKNKNINNTSRQDNLQHKRPNTLTNRVIMASKLGWTMVIKAGHQDKVLMLIRQNRVLMVDNQGWTPIMAGHQDKTNGRDLLHIRLDSAMSKTDNKNSEYKHKICASNINRLDSLTLRRLLVTWSNNIQFFIHYNLYHHLISSGKPSTSSLKLTVFPYNWIKVV